MSLISSRFVPPSGPDGADLLIIGEAPGEEEDKQLIPFVGPSGEKLDNFLEQAGYQRKKCKVMNICPYRPANNDFSLLEDSEQLKLGIQLVKSYIDKHPPKMILIVGAKALEYLLEKYSISTWRGTPLYYKGIRAIATIHPANLFRDYTLYPLILSDIRRAVSHINNPFPNVRNQFTLKPSGLDLEEAVIELSKAEWLSVDIESIKGTSHIICVGFASSKERAICIHNPSYDSIDPIFASAVQRILNSPAKKILHNGIFDKIVLKLNGIILDHIDWDTMVATHVMEPELPYGLDFLVSTYTYLPCYWAGVASGEDKAWSPKSSKRDSLYEYNAYDCIATYDIAMQQMKEMDKDQKKVFDFKMSCLPMAEDFTMTGFKVDEDRRSELRRRVNESMEASAKLIYALTGKLVNPRSHKKFQDFLYNELDLPIRKNRDGSVTADEDALVASITHCKSERDKARTEEGKMEWNKKIAIVKSFMAITGYLKLLSSYIDMTVSADGIVRSMFRPAATETSRWSASLFVDGSGFNAQTMPREKI